jgi:hypothetical protein
MSILAVLLAATLSSGNAEFDATARDGARAIAVSRAKAELSEKGPAPGALERAMLADPAAYEKPAEAERLCRGVFAAEAARQFAEKVRAIDERLGIGSTRVDVGSNRVDVGSNRVNDTHDSNPTPNDPNSPLNDPNLTLNDPNLTLIVDRHFAAAFAAERKAAVEAQAKTIVSATRPAEADFDSKEDWELREQMLQGVLSERKAPVFTENRQFINERIVEPVIQDARREQKRQAEYLMRARSDAAAPSKLAAELKSRLEENVKERRAKAEDPSKSWGVFAGTFERAVGPAVERRTLSRLERRIDAASLEVSAESIAKAIAENPAAHVKSGESEKLFRGAYAAQIEASSVDAAVAEAPDGERAELREYLAARLGDERVRKSVESKLQKDVLPKWREARAEAAAKQAAETWPALEDGTWCPSPELADSVAAKSDYAKAVREWRGEKGMEALAGASGGRPLMEEAERRADSGVAAAFDVARNAIASQNQIVDASHAAVLEESRRRRDEFWTKTPDLKAIVGLLTGEVEKRWDESRVETLWPDEAKRPANASEQHRALFPSVRRKIELLAKVILEEMNEPKPEEEKPQEEKPPEETPLEETPEAPPEEEIELAISVKRSGGTIEVELKQGESTVESATVPAKKDDFENAMFKVTGAMSRLLKLD